MDLYCYEGVVVRWKDGDTVVVEIDRGYDDRSVKTYRLARIDCPETHGARASEAGRLATAFVEERMPSGTKLLVRSVKTATGKERATLGRYVAELYLRDVNVSDMLVEN